jgi:DNA-binding NtrC family response regulator
MNGAATTVHVLALLPTCEDQASLSEIFRHSNWTLHFADGLGQTKAIIDALSLGVVISDCTLPDAGWQDVLCELQHRDVEPTLIVASRLADEQLWGQVLHLGGYDVLATPFRAQEVLRSVSLAWRYWREKLRTGARAPAKAMVQSALGGLRLAPLLDTRALCAPLMEP